MSLMLLVCDPVVPSEFFMLVGAFHGAEWLGIGSFAGKS